MQLRFLFECNLLIFAGCLAIHVQCGEVCKTDQYTIIASNGSFLRCLNCGTCHRGRGLYPPCGRSIPDPPNIECKVCSLETFSAELDSAPCHDCQQCAKYEIIAAPCTKKSDRICNGTCEKGYFYSKKDSTHNCQKCSYCCFDGKDEEVSECANQGLNVSKQHCRPRPDKDCSPVPSPTDPANGTKASKSNGTLISAIGSGFLIAYVIGLTIFFWYRKKKRMQLLRQGLTEEGNGKTTLSNGYNSKGPQASPADAIRVKYFALPNKDALGEGEVGSRKRSKLSVKILKPSERYDSISEEDPDEIREPIKIVKQPIKSQKEKEGSRVDFKFEVQGTSSLWYQWFKDGVELSEENNASLILECIKLRDFGCYTCQVSYQDGYGDIVKSSSAVLDVTPRCQNRMRLKYLSEVDLDTQEKIATYLENRTPGLGGWRQRAAKYGMEKHQIRRLENARQPGQEVMEFLLGSNPYLTVYSFCKTLKEHNMKRFDIVKVLESHLSIKEEST